jgi:hypothetical protein
MAEAPLLQGWQPVCGSSAHLVAQLLQLVCAVGGLCLLVGLEVHQLIRPRRLQVLNLAPELQTA